MILAQKISNEIKDLIRERKYNKDEIIRMINQKYGNVGNISFWYDICYNTICEVMGINCKRGERIKLKRRIKVNLKRKRPEM